MFLFSLQLPNSPSRLQSSSDSLKIFFAFRFVDLAPREWEVFLVGNNDEQAIRRLVSDWLAASKGGDTAAVLEMMTDDVVFMTPGREPFGKEMFAKSPDAMKGVSLEGVSDIKEIVVAGDWAWMRNHLRVTITPPGGKPSVRSGHVLTILRKKPDGRWVIARDANLLAPE
jgi:uncharacterized protein (TIGR02246 family)